MATETKRDSLTPPKGGGFSHASIMKGEVVFGITEKKLATLKQKYLKVN